MIGFTPAQVDAMTLWQFLACLDGYASAHGQDGRRGNGDGMSEDRMRDLGLL